MKIGGLSKSTISNSQSGREDRLGPPSFSVATFPRLHNLEAMESKSRKWLRHNIPTWVKPADEVFFVTVCCRERQKKSLLKSRIAAELISSIRFRSDRQTWFPIIALVVPDHVHMILRLGLESKGLSTEIRDWK